jgi:hypothetical protein
VNDGENPWVKDRENPHPEESIEGGKNGREQTEHRNENLIAKPRQHQLIQFGPGFW